VREWERDLCNFLGRAEGCGIQGSESGRCIPRFADMFGVGGLGVLGGRNSKLLLQEFLFVERGQWELTSGASAVAAAAAVLV